MKHLFVRILTLAAVLLLAAACVRAEGPMSADELFAHIREANVNPAFLPEGENMQITETAYDPGDGSVSYEVTMTASADALVISSAGQTAVYQDGSHYFHTIDGQMIVYLYAGADMDEEMRQYTSEAPFNWTVSEVITGAEVFSGTVRLTTEAGTTRTVYTADAETWLITDVASYSGDTLLLHSTVQRNVKFPRTEKSVLKQINGKNRTVTVIADADTEDEKRWSLTTGKGVIVYVVNGAGYDTQTYADAECTEPAADSGKGDVTLYTRRVSSGLNAVEILEKVKAANTPDAMSDAMAAVTSYGSTGTATGLRTVRQGDGWLYTQDQDGNSEYLNLDGTCWCLAYDGELERLCFADPETMDGLRETVVNGILGMSSPEEAADAFIEQGETSDTLFLQTVRTLEDGTVTTCYYACDPETCVVKRTQRYVRSDDGEYILTSEATIMHGADAPEDLEEHSARIRETGRTLTMITENGELTYTAGEGCWFSFPVCSDRIFADADFTQLPAPVEASGDTVVYLRPEN